ncbi:MAG: hypothetical protein KDK55_07235 [Chlamydiia bacterium]|nr:hypothetical protein [Chlamydiia bacterium]
MVSWLPGVTAFNTQAFIMYLLLGGNNLDMRYMYSVAHQGFGGVGFANLKLYPIKMKICPTLIS